MFGYIFSAFADVGRCRCGIVLKALVLVYNGSVSERGPDHVVMAPSRLTLISLEEDLVLVSRGLYAGVNVTQMWPDELGRGGGGCCCCFEH